MISPAPDRRVYLAMTPVDMRKGLDGLAAYVQGVLKADPYCGALFVFRGKRAGYLKILVWDGSGLCLLSKRLESGRFVWPPIVEGRLQLSAAQLALLLDGTDWRRAVVPEPVKRPEIV
jgi:transposase